MRFAGRLTSLVVSLACATPCGFVAASVSCEPKPVASPAAQSPEVSPVSEPPPEQSRGLTEVAGEFKHRPRWCFGAGSPVVGSPAVGPDGAIVVVTSEAYVHRLHPDGRYDWSFTMSAAPSGAASVLGQGQVLVGAVSGLVYAIYSTGTLAWRSRAPAPLISGLCTDHRQTSYVIGRDLRVYSISARGRFYFRAKLAATPFGDPLVVGRQELALLGVDGALVRSYFAGRSLSFDLGAGSDQRLVSDDNGRLYALAGRILSAFGKRKRPIWTRKDVTWVAASSSVVAGGEQRRVTWLDPETGEPRYDADSPKPALFLPALAGPDELLIPTDQGTLVLRRGVGVVGWLDSGPHRIVDVLYDEPRARVLVVSEPGILCGFDFPLKPAATGNASDTAKPYG